MYFYIKKQLNHYDQIASKFLTISYYKVVKNARYAKYAQGIYRSREFIRSSSDGETLHPR